MPCAISFFRLGAANPGGTSFVTSGQTHGQDIDSMYFEPGTAMATFANMLIGTTAAKLVGFHGATPVAQRAGAAQAAVAVTAATNSSPYGYAQAQADAIVALVNEIRATLVEKGLFKGAA